MATGSVQRINRFSHYLDPYLLLLLFLSSLALAPLLAPGYFYSTHDGRHSVFYLNMFDASIRDGALWPRWAMHHIQGYGYPTFIIQSPLGFYIGELFVLLGAGITAAAKWTWGVAFYASGWGMYCLTVHWLRSGNEEKEQRIDRARLAGLVAGLLYVYIPYHLAGMYVRGALNDTLLLAWYPWVLLAFDRLIANGTDSGWQRRLGVAILLLAGTLYTHTFALISFAPFLVVFVFFRLLLEWARRAHNIRWRSLLTSTLLAGIGGIGALLLYANFLLPLLVEGQSLQQQVYSTGTYDFRNHFVFFGQFLNPFWGTGFSDDPAGANDGMGFQVGLMAVLFVIVAIYQLWQGGQHWRPLMLFLLVSTLVILALMMPLAAPLWEAIPALGIIQFPWRLLSLVALSASALAAFVVANLMRIELDGEKAMAGSLILGLLVIFTSYGYIGADLQPVEVWREDGRAVFAFESEHPDMIAYTEWVDEPFQESPMTPDYASEDYVETSGQTDRLTRLAILEGSGEVLSQRSGGSSGGGVVRLNEAEIVRVHLFYFPGWQATIDGEPVPHRVSPPHGVIELDVPAGEHVIDVRMGATPVRTLGTGIAWGIFFAMVALLLWPSTKDSTTKRR